jgi:hypothetical protein
MLPSEIRFSRRRIGPRRGFRSATRTASFVIVSLGDEAIAHTIPAREGRGVVTQDQTAGTGTVESQHDRVGHGREA